MDKVSATDNLSQATCPAEPELRGDNIARGIRDLPTDPKKTICTSPERKSVEPGSRPVFVTYRGTRLIAYVFV